MRIDLRRTTTAVVQRGFVRTHDRVASIGPETPCRQAGGVSHVLEDTLTGSVGAVRTAGETDD